MSLKVVSIFVALAPSVACAVLGFVIEVGPGLKCYLERFFRSAPRVEWLKELISHGAFLGGVIAATLGVEKASHTTVLIAALWFVGLTAISYALAARLHALEERDHEQEGVRFRKTAGLIRSIVRSELVRTTETKKGRDGRP
jgi:hypothetical protein